MDRLKEWSLKCHCSLFRVFLDIRGIRNLVVSYEEFFPLGSQSEATVDCQYIMHSPLTNITTSLNLALTLATLHTGPNSSRSYPGLKKLFREESKSNECFFLHRANSGKLILLFPEAC